jgi:hypothetical protein
MKRYLMKVAAIMVFSLLISEAYAGSVTLDLVRLSLNNVDDVAGRWQHEGGQVFKAGTQIGNYAINRRVTSSGTSPQNTAMVTMTIFFLGASPPQNITLQGAHDFSSGISRGSVSAASTKYNWIRDAIFTGNAAANTLQINWLGSTGLIGV